MKGSIKMKATMKNFKEVKENRYQVIQFNPTTLKRTFAYGNLNIMDATLEVEKNTKQGFLSMIIPANYGMNLIHWESTNKSRITLAGIAEILKEEPYERNIKGE
jgi:hypothetical protein